MPAIAPGAEFITTSVAAATSSKSSAARMGADQASLDASQGTASQGRQGNSAFDALVGLATPPATPVQMRSNTNTTGGLSAGQGMAEGLTGAGSAAGMPAFGEMAGLTAGANGAAPGEGTDMNAASPGPDINAGMPGLPAQAGPVLPGAGQPVDTPDAHTDPLPAIATLANGPRETPAEAAATAARIATAGPWTGQTGAAAMPAANDRPTGAAGMPAFQTAPGSRNNLGIPAQPLTATASAAALAAAAPVTATADSRAAAPAMAGTAGPAAPTAAATTAAAAATVVAAAAGQAAQKSATAKTIDADSLAKTGAEAKAAAVTAKGVAPAEASAATTQGATATQVAADPSQAGKDTKPPVMATITPATTQQQASATASTAATAPPAAPSSAPAIVPAPAAGDSAPSASPAASASTAAQQMAAGTASAAASAATAEAKPAGRFAQARQGVDERDSSMAAARSKGKSDAGAASQSNAKHAATGASPQPQSGTVTSPAPRPDATMASREIPIAAAQAPAATAMPLATDAVRVAPVAMDAGMTTMTNTGPGSVRGGSPSAAEMGAGQTPRFTPHTANQLAAQISQRFANGSRVFGIRLDPAELGRVDIRMELSQNNRVRATLTVERGDTLAEMQRSTRDLERALNDAGLELAEDGLTFQLSEGSGDEQSAEPEQGGSFNVYGQDDDGAQELGAEIDTGPADAYGFRLSRRDGVDLRV